MDSSGRSLKEGKNMAGNKKEKEKKYNLVQRYVCQECKKILDIQGPCKKCGGLVFNVICVVQEI